MEARAKKGLLSEAEKEMLAEEAVQGDKAQDKNCVLM
jgi:hypothetical protein